MNRATSRYVSVLCAGLIGALGWNQGWTESRGDQVKEWVDRASDSLKKAIDEIGDDWDALQNHLDQYSWKGLIQDEAKSGLATLKYLELNGKSKAVIVKPGERIVGRVVCELDRGQCSSFSVYRICLGIKGKGAQTTIGNRFGLTAGESLEKFSLIAPAEPGLYEIRFRVAESLTEKGALDAWLDEQGEEPLPDTTIGVIFVH